MSENTNRIQEYIVKNKKFPEPAECKKMIETEYKPPERTADGRKGCFLYF